MCQSSVDPTLILRHATKWGRVFCSLEALECIMITIGNSDFNRTVNKPDTCLKMLLNSLKMQIWRYNSSIFLFMSFIVG